eukprot:TRINITY_DN1774_c0_g1_i2.p2 TRINITY_DN1774_c0_g1~~TRINITY_DN1774_c0_g1_i2.p2  ORF type:complete len:133 (-),score=46.89 TRINITY_DN1774_c0_g1_i2:156-497(-)
MSGWEDEHTSLLDSQRKKMREQDQGIDALGHTVSRIKGIAVDIGQEIDTSNNLLTDIDRGVARADSQVKAETDRIIRFDRKSSTMWLWVVICFLFLIIIVLIILKKEWFTSSP